MQTNTDKLAGERTQIKTIVIEMEGGVIQDINGIPEGVEVLVIDQDEIQCGENGHVIYNADETLTFGKADEALHANIQDGNVEAVENAIDEAMSQ